MAKNRGGDRLARERARRAAAKPGSEPQSTAASARAAARICAWCGAPIDVKPVGRIPKWCSGSCRQRAWEQTRAAASGLAAVKVVERIVAVPSPGETSRPGRDGWPALLGELTHELDTGHIYRRALPDLATALDQVLHAYHRAAR